VFAYDLHGQHPRLVDLGQVPLHGEGVGVGAVGEALGVVEGSQVGNQGAYLALRMGRRSRLRGRGGEERGTPETFRGR
jgi:hypothetical protein